MKKLLAILLVCVFAFSVVACGGGSDASDDGGNDSSVNFDDGSASDDASDDSSVEEPSDDSSVEDPSDDSSVEDSSGDTSDDPVEEPEVLPTQFISWKKPYYDGITDVKSGDATSLAITNFNEAVEAGDIAILTRDYGETIKSEGQDYSEFAVAIFKYNHEAFGYTKVSYEGVGSANAETAIPEDGFAVAISKDFPAKVSIIEALSADTLVYPHGFVVNHGLDTTISSAATAPAIDGSVSEEEYGAAIWDINPENELVSYAQFASGEYNATAKVYLTYDADRLYCGVVVRTPDHFCDLTQEKAGDMWNKTCIQFNILSEDPNGEYIMDGRWDQHNGDKDAGNSNVLRQYGIAVNDSGETINCVYFAASGTDEIEVVNVRDDDTQTTTYEFSIPWTDIGRTTEEFIPEVGKTFGFSLSVNSGTAEVEFQNITLRDGGGIIGINDWSKIPAITFGE